jgi:hypothetical protein
MTSPLELIVRIVLGSTSVGKFCRVCEAFRPAGISSH